MQSNLLDRANYRYILHNR